MIKQLLGFFNKLFNMAKPTSPDTSNLPDTAKLTPQLLFTDNSSYDLTLTPEEYESVRAPIHTMNLNAKNEEFVQAANGPMTVIAKAAGAELNAIAVRAATDCDGTEADFIDRLDRYTRDSGRFEMTNANVSITETDQLGNSWQKMVANTASMGYNLSGDMITPVASYSDESSDAQSPPSDQWEWSDPAAYGESHWVPSPEEDQRRKEYLTGSPQEGYHDYDNGVRDVEAPPPVEKKAKTEIEKELDMWKKVLMFLLSRLGVSTEEYLKFFEQFEPELQILLIKEAIKTLTKELYPNVDYKGITPERLALGLSALNGVVNVKKGIMDYIKFFDPLSSFAPHEKPLIYGAWTKETGDWTRYARAIPAIILNAPDRLIEGIQNMFRQQAAYANLDPEWSEAYSTVMTAYLSSILVNQSIKGIESIGALSKGAGKVSFDTKKLLASGNQLDKGGELTKAGRALQKHGSRPGSIYSQATGNIANKNALGNQTLESILNNPNATPVIRHHAMYGDILEIKIPGGMGARFSADGTTFIGFLE